MSNTSNSTGLFDVPALSAEDAAALELPTAPIRISGFLAFLLGLISFASVLGETLIVIPLLSIAIGLFALRPYEGEKPLGMRAAMIGMLAASLFLTWGVWERHLKYNQLSEEATRFAHDWLDVVRTGNRELSIELHLHPARRQPATVPLKEYYERSEAGRETLKGFAEQELLPALLKLGDKPKWVLKMPPKVFTHYGRELTQTVWVDETGNYTNPVKVQLEYLPPKADGERAQWKVDTIGVYMGEKPITV